MKDRWAGEYLLSFPTSRRGGTGKERGKNGGRGFLGFEAWERSGILDGKPTGKVGGWGRGENGDVAFVGSYLRLRFQHE